MYFIKKNTQHCIKFNKQSIFFLLFLYFFRTDDELGIHNCLFLPVQMFIFKHCSLLLYADLSLVSLGFYQCNKYIKNNDSGWLCLTANTNFPPYIKN